jgi:hypothetical protein
MDQLLADQVAAKLLQGRDLRTCRWGERVDSTLRSLGVENVSSVAMQTSLHTSNQARNNTELSS